MLEARLIPTISTARALSLAGGLFIERLKIEYAALVWIERTMS